MYHEDRLGGGFQEGRARQRVVIGAEEAERFRRVIRKSASE